MSDIALSVIFLGLLIAAGVLMFRHGDYPRQDD